MRRNEYSNQKPIRGREAKIVMTNIHLFPKSTFVMDVEFRFLL